MSKGIVFFVCLLCVNITANFLEKKGMTMLPRITSFSQLYSLTMIRSIITNPYLVSGIALSVGGVFLWLGALSTLKLSYLSPMSGVSYLLTAIVGLLFLGEVVTTVQWVGIVVIIAGVALINL